MITIKLLEIRDRATFIPAFAFHTVAEEEFMGDPFTLDPKDTSGAEEYLLRRAGFQNGKGVFLGKLGDAETQCDPYLWKNARTMTTAHEWIRNHWKEIESGDVIDVEFILGESKTKKLSERIEG